MANPRRTPRRATAVRPRPAQPTANVAAAAAVEEVPMQSSKRVDLKSEYTYVVSDLRQLGIVTAGIFTLMFIIGFFI